MIKEGMDGKNAHLEGNTLCDYAEGALDAHAHAAAEAHLRECPDCLRELKAVRAYFREISDLEPVQAPPNFLANVRARLPQPSPWASIVGAMMRPWRAVPMSIAGLTILGVAIISLYVQQRGGITETSVAMAPARPEASAPSPEPKAPVPLPAEQSAAEGTSGQGAAAPPAPEPRPADDSPTMRHEEPKAAASGASGADAESRGLGSRPPRQVARLAKGSASGANEAALRRLAPPAERLADAKPTPMPVAPASKPGKMSLESDDFAPAPPAAAPQVAADPDRGVREDKAKKDAGYADEAAAMDELASAKEERAEREAAPVFAQAAPAKKAKSSAHASRSPAPALSEEAPAPAGAAAPPHPSFTLKPRNVKDTSAVLSGLKAMGAEILPAAAGSGATHRLRVPRSMLPEIRPYLIRYGEADEDGAAAADEDGMPIVSLRFILP
jgi:hypothetical protein